MITLYENMQELETEGVPRVKKIVRKVGLLCSTLLLALLLTGCVGTSVEELMTLPQLPMQYTGLSKQIDELIKNGYEYAAPLTGRNIQSVQMIDINGDGIDEVLAFFRLPSDEKQLKIFVFRRTEDSYTRLCTIESAGTGIDSVYCHDVTGDGKMELIVGWKISADVQTVAVYSLGPDPAVLMSSGYARFSIEELDGDSIPSLLLFRTDSEGNSVAEFYSWHDETMSVSYRCLLSSDMAELSRGSVVSGGLTEDGLPAVFVTGINNQGMAVTDILTYQKELGLVNVALDAATGRSKAVYNYCQIRPQDIDDDGLIELPVPASTDDTANQTGGVISWFNYDDHGEREWARDTYHCPNADWYFTLPEDWHGTVSAAVVESASNETCVVLQVNNENVLAIYSISGENRESRVSRNNYLILAQRPAILYAGELLAAAEKYDADQSLLYRSFHLITNFWLS